MIDEVQAEGQRENLIWGPLYQSAPYFMFAGFSEEPDNLKYPDGSGCENAPHHWSCNIIYVSFTASVSGGEPSVVLPLALFSFFNVYLGQTCWSSGT